MKHRLKLILKMTIVLILGVWILSKIPFSQDINREISAHIYENGVIAGETTVIIDGEKSNYLFTKEENYFGKFHILSYEKTGRENMKAKIKWVDEPNTQRLFYFQNATFPDMDILWTILINEEMTQFALMLKDGTVIATSDELFKLYTKYISYDNNSGSISVTGNIPKF